MEIYRIGQSIATGIKLSLTFGQMLKIIMIGEKLRRLSVADSLLENCN